MHIPNTLSYSRVVLAAIGWIFALLGNSVALGVILLLSGLTDTLDGVIARRMGLASPEGARIDSFADAIMLASALVWVFLVTPLFTEQRLILILAITAQVLAYVVALFKLRRLASLHLRSSKIMAVVAYVFIVHALFMGYNSILFYITAALMFYSGIEETVIVLRMRHTRD